MDLPQNLIPQQDLLQQVKSTREPIKRSSWKLLSFEILSVALAGGLGYAFADFMRAGGPSVLLLIITGAFFAVSAVTGMVTFLLGRRFATVLLETIAFLAAYAALFHPQAILLASAGAIVLLFSFWGDLAVKNELESRVKISFFDISRQKIGKMLTGYLLAGIVLTVPIWGDQPLPIPQNQFRSIYSAGVKVAAAIAPGLRYDATVEDFAESVVKKELICAPHSNCSDQSKLFASLTPDEQDKMIRAAAAQEIAQAEKNLNLHITPAMEVSDVFYQYFSVMSENWKTSFGNIFLAIWIFILFMVLRGIGAFLAWASALLAVIIVEASIASGAVAVIGEAATREHVVLT